MNKSSLNIINEKKQREPKIFRMDLIFDSVGKFIYKKKKIRGFRRRDTNKKEKE